MITRDMKKNSNGTQKLVGGKRYQDTATKKLAKGKKT